MSAPVTLVVVSWNTRDLLEACLRALKPDADDGRVEAWVVDNASSDGSAEMVRSRFPWVCLIASDVNLGYGAAVNAVAERAQAPWIAPANADVEVAPGAIDALLRAGQRNPRVGIVAPRLMRPEGEVQHSVHRFPTVTLSAIVALDLPRFDPALGDRLCIEGAWDPTRARLVDWAHGAFLLVRREAFDAVGGFDRGQWMYAEDIDLAWRMRRAGWTTCYEPAAVVHHAVGAATSQAFAEHRARRYMAATYSWMAGRRGLAVTWAFAAVNCAGAVVRLALFGLLARTGAARWGRARDRARMYLALYRLGLRPRRKLVLQR